MSGGVDGLSTMLGIQWRTRRRSITVWVLALSASMVGTAAAVAGLYDTPAKIHTYAAAVTSGRALQAINGRVEGIDSLGGVIQDEFGFLAAFVMPLLGISLVASLTRREEETGRLETLLGGRIARAVPPLAAMVLAGGAIVVTAAAFAVGLVAAGVPGAAAVLYSASLGLLAYVFAGVAALLAQLALHARGVYTSSLVLLAGAYLLRGIGDVTNTPLTWLSPLGWAEKAAPFGPMRWWALAIPLLVGTVAAGAGLALAGARDVGSALVRGGGGPAHASAFLRRPCGLATWIHRPALLGWLAAAVLLAATMGALSRQMLDALSGNPALASAVGASTARPVDGLVAMVQLYVAIIATGYAVQAVGTLRAEEAAGRLEPRLAGTVSRARWLGVHTVVILAGLAVIIGVASLVLAWTTAGSLRAFEPDGGVDVGGVILAGFAYLPAEATLAALAFALFGLRPRAFPAVWVVYAATTFIAFLGAGLKLPSWVLDLAAMTHIGNPPLGSAPGPALAWLTAAALLLVAAAFAGFRRRGIPQA